MQLKNWRSAAALARTVVPVVFVVVVVVVVLLEAKTAILAPGSESSCAGGDASGSGTLQEILLTPFQGVSC
ncbi:hypothetical protein CGRA01v4_06925 [Colletotrichum graminicola]|nr:hypothetical protein CGRA01v4_06925 [Colletotrichum graminicola]